MTKRQNILAHTLVMTVFVFAQLSGANGFDLTGAWASDAANCSRVFKRNGKGVAFAKNSEVYGSGFIIDRDQIIGGSVRCRIRARRDGGSISNVIAACATDIMLSSVQLSARKVDANTFARLFPGMDGMEIKYYRCSAH